MVGVVGGVFWACGRIATNHQSGGMTIHLLCGEKALANNWTWGDVDVATKSV